MKNPTLSLFPRSATILPAIAAALALPLFAPGGANAQQGDREGHVMKPPPEDWDIPEAPVLSPGEEANTFTVEDGFRIELVASEPMVHDPVALAFDGNGRIWVAEMLGYMADIDGKTETQVPGRISVLEDTDGDGHADKHTVFLEDVVLARAVSLVDADKTLLYADNEQLYEIGILIDEDGAITAGEQNVIDPDYAAGGNPEHKGNGLIRAMDNWIYSAKSDRRYRKIDGEWVQEKTEDRGQWGIVQDNYGRLLTNTNSNLVTAEEIPPGLRLRNPHHDFRARASTRVEDQSVWPARITPGVNRGYLEPTLDDDGYLVKPTAVSGLALYRGDQFPTKFQGNLFIPEPSGNLVKRLVSREKPDGYLSLKSATRGREFFTSTDERSRIVNAHLAPDGTLYFVDFYRGILQHAVYMTSYLRAQVLDRGLEEPLGKGRIWRIAHEKGKKTGPAPRMQEESPAELVAHLEHPNGWWRDTAQRLLVERGGKEALPGLRGLLAKSDQHLAKIHALWTLEGLGALSLADLETAFADKHPRVVEAAARIAGDAAPALADDAEAVAELLRSAASSGRADIRLRRQVAASLGFYFDHASGALADLAGEHAEKDPLLLDLAMSGLAGKEITLLAKLPGGHPLRIPLVAAIADRGDSSEKDQLLGLLDQPSGFRATARVAASKRRIDWIQSILEAATDEERPGAIRTAVLDGLAAGGKSRGFKPIPVKALPEALTSGTFAKADGKKRERARKIFKVGSGEEEVFLKTDADRKQFAQGQRHYQRICLGCHQAHGNGQQFLAPPLVGSEWVEGSVDRLVALVMDGMQGPVEVGGKTYTAPEIQPLMPGLRANPEFTDEQLAAIMTYVRNAWGNGASPVPEKEVATYRENTETRAPWSAEELLEKWPK